MKLATCVAVAALATLVGLGSVARADDGWAPRGAPADGQQGQQGPRARPRAQIRQILLSRFDHNHDGRLEPQERRQAIRALRRLTRRLARQRAVIQRYDLDGDGDVGPGEMPPNVANRLRHLDRNRDGWIDDADQ